MPATLGFTVSQAGSIGNWDVAAYPDFSYDTRGIEAQGQINYTVNEPITVTNATGGLYGIDFHVSDIKGNRAQFYWWNGVMRFYWVLDVYKGNEHLYAWFYIAHEQGIILQTHEIYVGNSHHLLNPQTIGGTTGAGVANIPIVFPNDPTTNTTFVIQFQRTSTTTTRILYSTYQDYYGSNWFLLTSHAVYQENYTNSEDFWDGAQAKLYIGYEGVGHFNVSFPDMATVETPADYNPEQTIMTTGPSFGILSNIYFFFLQLWSIIVSSITFVIAMIQAFWPIFPIIFIFYLLDLFYTAYQTGGFHAIGDTFYRIWNMIVETADLIVRAIRAIGQYVSAGIGWILGLFGIAL